MESLTRFEVFEAKHPLFYRIAHSFERIIDKCTIYVLILLTILLVLEFTIDTAPYEHWITTGDWFIIVFFFSDLVFKWVHSRSALRFVRLYWLEILAVLPFYYVFRFFTEFGLLGESVADVQKLTHEAMLAKETELLSQEAKVLREASALKEAELLGQETNVFGRIMRFLQNSARMVGARLHLAHETMAHHSTHNGNKRPRLLKLSAYAVSFLIVWLLAGVAVVIYTWLAIGFEGIALWLTSLSIWKKLLAVVLLALYLGIVLLLSEIIKNRKSYKPEPLHPHKR